MTDDKLLKKVGEMLIVNNKTLLDAIEERMDQKLQALEKRLEEKLSKKILESQADTIEVLSELIHTGYNLHEARIQRVEDKLNLPPLKQKS